MADKLSLKKRLLNIQTELRAPKGQTNSFGNYKYRSCEDILEAVKPLCSKYDVLLTETDSVALIGDRYYVVANARLEDVDSDARIEVEAYAREEEVKKGMDSSQITGSASSYARKYALNGLFNIDDTKDADTQDNRGKTENTPKQSTGVASDKQINWMRTEAKRTTGLSTPQEIDEWLSRGEVLNMAPSKVPSHKVADAVEKIRSFQE